MQNEMLMYFDFKWLENEVEVSGLRHGLAISHTG